MYLSVVLIGVTTVFALMYYDVRYYRLPNLLTAVFAFMGMLHTQLASPEELVNHLLAGFIGFASYTLISLFYRHLRKREEMGMGDAKFFCGDRLMVGRLFFGASFTSCVDVGTHRSSLSKDHLQACS